MSKLLNKIFKTQTDEKLEITVLDNNTELPDFRKIAIPDLKQYLVDGYNEIRQVKNENEILKEDLEKAKKYKDLNNATLVTLNEYKKRDNENKNKIQKLENNIANKNEEISKLNESINHYKIYETELDKRERNINIEKEEAIREAIQYYREDLISKIEGTKGNISKSKLYNIIESV